MSVSTLLPVRFKYLEFSAKIQLVSFFCLIFSYSHAQSTFEKLIGTPGTENGHFIRVDDNNLFLVGFTNAVDINDFYIAKLNTDYTIAWEKNYGTATDDRAFGIMRLNNGNFLISGYSDRGSRTLGIEIDANGSVIKSEGFGSFHDRLHKLLPTSDGGYLQYGELEGLVPGHNQIALIKYDKDMLAEWNYYYTFNGTVDALSNFEMYGRDAVEVDDGGFILLGSYSNFVNAPSGRKVRLFKISENGDLEWVKGFHGGIMDNATSITKSTDDGYVITATTNSYTNNGTTDLMVAKFNTSGEVVWIKTYGGNGNEAAGEVKPLANGGFVICGSTDSFGHGRNDGLIMSIDDTGVLNWARTYGDIHEDHLVKVDTLPDGFLLSGNSEGATGLNIDIFLIKTDLLGNTGDCAIDVTSLVDQRTVSATSFDGLYIRGNFGPFNARTSREADIHTQEKILCVTCPQGSKVVDSICHNQVMTLDMKDANATAYQWQDGSDAPVYIANESGNYWVDVTLPGCQYRDSISLIAVPPLPTGFLGEDRKLCAGQNVTLDLSSLEADDYLWQDGSTDPVFTIASPGSYTLRISNQCETVEDMIAVDLIEPENVFVPNVMTPNGDRHNEYFLIDDQLLNSTLKVYNRYGKIVYEAVRYQNDWDASGISSGVYYYSLINFCDGGILNGWINIIK
ncbi:gliding motility-associated C-terminal domain-containing protein [Fulvivirgaceae bacterium BMA12]|uniref:Gliding motility-associated C-terminal domain-containing protein n=1 Tax=Agaribacillus aureus TaxID=3051825 RepID=A0ABT8LA56_9BACT|nr:gliding motility-associated C-terminal domain-containing protein [Fulvivirgaceae bacterium BMA12]